MISKETAEKIADLARLELTNDQIETASKHLTAVLKHFAELGELKTDNVEPLTTPTQIESFLQDDVVQPCKLDMLENAPDKTGRLFKVPPVV